MKHIFTTFKQFISKPLLVACALLAMSGNAWGDDPKPVYNGSTWYSLYDATGYSRSTATGGTIHTYSNAFLPHDGTFSFDTKLPGKDSYSKTNTSSSKISDPKDYGVETYNISFGGKSCSANISASSVYSRSSNKILWTTYYTHKYTYTYNYTTVTGSGLTASSTSFDANYEYKLANTLKTVYIKNVKIPLAKHIRLANGSTGTTSVTKSFADTYIENYSDASTVDFRSFLTNGNISVSLTSGDPEVFRLGTMDNTTGAITTSAAGKTYNVGANACASANGAVDACASGKLGKIENYSFYVYFYPKAAKSYSGTITISDGTSTAIVTLSGKGKKCNQTLSWLSDYSADKPVINVDDEVVVASATSGLPVTYSSSNSSIVEVTHDGTMILGKSKGDVTITASQAGNDKWNAASSISKTFNVTDKIRQIITWQQNLSKLDPDAATKTVTLTAVVKAIDDETGELTEVPAQTAKIKYAITGASGIATVSGKTLTYSTTEGSTTITATVDEDETYAAASVSKPVRVRRPASGCDDPLIPTNLSGEYEFFAMNTNELTKEITIDRREGDPDKLTFEHKGEKWAKIFYTGSIEVHEYVNGAWGSSLYSVTPTEGEYKSTPEIQLSRNATKIKIVRPKGGQGYHYINNLEITRAQFIESTTSAINLGNVARLAEQDKELTIKYSNCKSDLTVSHADDQLQLLNAGADVTRIELGECGEVGSYTMNVKLIPTEPGSFSDNIVIKDAISGKQLTIPVTATVAKSDQTITWTQEQSVSTTDNLVLAATASSGLSVSYEVVSGSDVATVNSSTGAVTIIKDGEVTFRATQAGDKYFNAAEAVERTFTIAKVTPTITADPTASDVLLPATLAASTLSGGEATVDGGFAWENTTTAVERNNTGYTVVFTPSNTNWYTTATCTVVVGIQKYEPEVTTNELAGSAISYGQTLVSSEISGNLVITDIIPVPNETVEGTVAWKDATLMPSVGETTAKAVFTPSDDTWFLPVELDVAITVNPIAADYAATATVYAGQSLSEVELTNATTGLGGEAVSGSVTWKDDVTAISFDEDGTQTLPIVFTSSNANYNSGEGLCTITVLPGVVFNGGDWNEGSSWSGGEVPTASDRVIIDADVTISSDVEVTGLTVNAGKTLTIADGGQLTIGAGNSLSRETYGNVVVEIGGKLNLNAGELDANDFTLYSGFDNNHQPKSGQVSGQEMLSAHGHAYFILDLDPAGTATEGWYTFTVPFPVDELRGVERLDNGNWTAIVNEKDYAVMAYDEVRRAQTGKGWKKYTGILQPGVGYTLGVDPGSNSYRFTKTATGAFNTSMAYELQASSEGESVDIGWNSLGNGTMSYVTLNEEPLVQIYDHESNTYTGFNSAAITFAVGAAYFVQTASDGDELNMTAELNGTIRRAPQRDQTNNNRFGVSLATADKLCDNLFVTCEDEASATYTIGKDVQKMGNVTGTKVARMWTNAKGTKLCAVNAAYVNGQAIIPLQLFSPTKAEYTLSLDSNPDEDVYLMRNGNIVWNLTSSDYTFELNEGTDDTYALQVIRRVNNTATGVDAIDADNHGTDFVEKMIVNGQLFILRDGALYDALGKKVTSL